MSSELSLQNLSRQFGETCAVDKVTLNIRPGQFVGVIGRSGAGKSTMLRLINRLVDPSDMGCAGGAILRRPWPWR